MNFSDGPGPEISSPSWKSSFIVHALLAVATPCVPLALWIFKPWFISSTYGSAYQPFELLGFAGAAALALGVVFEIRKGGKRSFEDFLPALTVGMIGLLFLSRIVEHSARSFDYQCYETAMFATVTGRNPYAGCYLYPPFLIQGMGWVYGLVDGAITWSAFSVNANTSRLVFFFLYQYAQWVVVIAAAVASVAFVRRLGFRRGVASLIVGCLFIVDTPLTRTVIHNQINAGVLLFLLCGVMWQRDRPVAGGILTALGCHLKLYPLLIFIPWLLLRRWKVLAAGVLSLAAVFLLQTRFLSDLSLWKDFLEMGRSFGGNSFFSNPFFRDNSLHSLVFNTFRIGTDVPPEMAVRITTIILSVGAAGWMVWRFIVRERSHRSLAAGPAGPGGVPETFREIGHGVDAIALMLLVSPLVWEHHYLLALPVVFWSLSVTPPSRWWITGICAFAIFGIPTFDMYPFSYNRLAGLVGLLIATPPGSVPLVLRESADRTIGGIRLVDPADS